MVDDEDANGGVCVGHVEGILGWLYLVESAGAGFPRYSHGNSVFSVIEPHIGGVRSSLRKNPAENRRIIRQIDGEIQV